jgi:hypothetical protein
MKPNIKVLLGVCMMVASLLLCSASHSPVVNAKIEPLTSHSVEEALNHALLYIDQNHRLGLNNLVWKSSVDNHPDLIYATHHVFINLPETVGEIQAQFAIHPTHSGFVTEQLTIIIHAPDNQRFSHKVTLIDSEKHTLWVGTVDVDGHVTEYIHFK